MERRPATLFFTLFFCLALSCFSDWQPPHVQGSRNLKHPVLVYLAQEPVKGELHRVGQPVSASCASVNRDHVDPSALPQPAASRSLALAGKFSQPTIVSFQLKDYLSQIYPSHNFW